jgi:hypothetical protein
MEGHLMGMASIWDKLTWLSGDGGYWCVRESWRMQVKSLCTHGWSSWRQLVPLLQIKETETQRRNAICSRHPPGSNWAELSKQSAFFLHITLGVLRDFSKILKEMKGTMLVLPRKQMTLFNKIKAEKSMCLLEGWRGEQSDKVGERGAKGYRAVPFGSVKLNGFKVLFFNFHC